MASGDEKGRVRKSFSFGLTSFSNFVDEHLQLVQRSLYGLGILTLFGIARHYKFWTKFYTKTHLPAEFYIRNVKLRGKVVDICSTSNVLLVDHQPPIRTPSLLSLTKPDARYLRVQLAGINISSTSYNWLKSNLINNIVWFRLLESAETDIIPAIVYYRPKYSIWRSNINIHIVYYGMATVRSPTDTDSTSQLYNRLLDQLVQAEIKAKKKGVGDWERVTWKSWLKEKLCAIFYRNK